MSKTACAHTQESALTESCCGCWTQRCLLLWWERLLQTNRLFLWMLMCRLVFALPVMCLFKETLLFWLQPVKCILQQYNTVCAMHFNNAQNNSLIIYGTLEHLELYSIHECISIHNILISLSHNLKPIKYRLDQLHPQCALVIPSHSSLSANQI